MKIVVLMRYPKMDSAKWKRLLIDNLINEGFDVSLIFGESTIFSQFKAGLKLYGLEILKKKKSFTIENDPKLFQYFSSKISVKKIKSLNSLESQRYIESIKPDLILLLGSGIIRDNILSLPKVGTLHCHQGYLPTFRGINTIEWSIFLDHEVYITIHFVDKGIDTGDILMRKQISINELNTIEDVRKKCQSESVKLIETTTKKLTDGSLVSILQKPEDGRQYFKMHPFFIDIVNRKLSKSIK